MVQHGNVLGIDFGTSNSAAGHLYRGEVRRIEWAPGQTTIPTTFFFDYETRETLIGEPANAALLHGRDGRFMRALKRVLGTGLMHEQRQILNARVTFVDIVARFLRHLKARAEAQTGLTFDRALSGRPVVFHAAGDPREAQAENDLRACYMAAGFRDVAFMPEPQAAAIASKATERPGEIGLIVDIGGGTSDFSLFRAERDGIAVLANHGLRLGGTDFDRAISLGQVMPLLGKGTSLRKAIGPGLTPAPVAIFNDLATWEKIPFLYTAQNRRMAAEMTRQAERPDRMARLSEVLENELGHEVAFAVERGKIAANADRLDAVIDLAEVEPGLSVPLPGAALGAGLAPFGSALADGARETLRRGGIDGADVGRVIYVGGSSLMQIVSASVRPVTPRAAHVFSEVFTAVTDGLILASQSGGWQTARP
ncbi:MAG: Hsp70 family protein [Rhodobacteraceae bacterium]|nr:Hsp70 family protein [Paracoccaceae bacterium]